MLKTSYVFLGMAVLGCGVTGKTSSDDSNDNKITLSVGKAFHFEEGVDIPEADDKTYDLEVADINNDGKLDVVLGNSGPFQISSGETINGQNQIYLGDGKGGFTVSKVSDDEGRTSAVAAYDLNGDGNLDLLFGRISQPILIFYGNGTGGFGQAENLEDVGYYTYALRIKDLDGDGIVDLIAGNADHASRIYFGK